MHPFPSPMLFGSGSFLVGVINVPNIGSTTWNVPYPIGTLAGDYIVIMVANASDIITSSFTASGGYTVRLFNASIGSNNLLILLKQLNSTDISSGISGSLPYSNCCGSVFIFRGPNFETSLSSNIQQAALSNGATATLTGATPGATSTVVLGVLMTPSAAFTATPLSPPWQSALVTGANCAYCWQMLSGGYTGQNITWSNVQNMSGWCAVLEDLRR